jgi:RNA polymerase sigma-70 factor (ECF subfamily)
MDPTAGYLIRPSMSTSASLLVRAFREGCASPAPRPAAEQGPELDDLEDEELARCLDDLVAVGRAAWPEIGTIDGPALAKYVGARVGSGADVDPSRGADFAIAWACAAGSTAGIAALEAAAEPVIVPALRKLRLDDAAIDDVRARLRLSLFVDSETRPAHIASWSGRGDLLGWLRVCAVREGLKSIRKVKAANDEAIDLAREIASPDDDPHQAYELRMYAPLFREALSAALADLPPRERALLAQHHLDGLSIDRLAVLHGVHRATAARWVSAARERLVASARAAFQARTHLEDSACASVMRRIRPELDLTLRRVLAG